MIQNWQRGDYLISTENHRLDVHFIHDFLTNRAYWALGRSLDLVRRSIEHSLNFGIYTNDRQIGFARVVTDFATFAWLADVFILEEYRGKGLGVWLIEVIVNHPELQGLRRWLLATRDKHELYQRVGFNELATPEIWMERFENLAN